MGKECKTCGRKKNLSKVGKIILCDDCCDMIIMSMAGFMGRIPRSLKKQSKKKKKLSIEEKASKYVRRGFGDVIKRMSKE